MFLSHAGVFYFCSKLSYFFKRGMEKSEFCDLLNRQQKMKNEMAVREGTGFPVNMR